MNDIELWQGDCLELIKQIPDNSVDLIITDPPYDIVNTKPGSNSKLGKSMVGYGKDIEFTSKSYDYELLNEYLRVCKVPNIYIFCNKKQLPEYFNFFVDKHNMLFNILFWNKLNAMPTYYNKYLTDCEYIFYAKKKGAHCKPQNYEDAKTIFQDNINVKDKKLYKHPTIKPVNLIEKLIRNSSKEGDVILDPFAGSGTTGVACKNLNRKFIGIELDEGYFNIAKNRINEAGKNDE